MPNHLTQNAPTVSVVIPVARSDASSLAMTHAMIADIHATGLADAIIVVTDDGSDDATALPGEMAGATWLAHRSSRGLGAAIKTGIHTTHSDVIAVIEPTDQPIAGELNHLIALTTIYTMVVGITPRPDRRAPMTIVWNLLTRYLTGFRVRAGVSGCRVINGDIARRFAYLLPDNTAYSIALEILLRRAGLPITHAPMKFASQKQTEPFALKNTVARITYLFQLSVLYLPLRLFVPSSVALMATGSIYITWRLLAMHRFSGMGGLALSAGVLMFMVGLIFEQLALLRYARSENQ